MALRVSNRSRVTSKMRKLSGFLKDTISIWRAKSNSSDRPLAAFHVALIRATSHMETVPNDRDVATVLQSGTSSRLRVTRSITLLTERLAKTSNWVVALKCLTLIHKALHQGGFMLHDQISYQISSHNGPNYLNLSHFRDHSTPFEWEASSRIRWYAEFLECLIETSTNLGRFFDTPTPPEQINILPNPLLVKHILAIHELFKHTITCPLQTPSCHLLIRDAFQLVALDSLNIHDELRARIDAICVRVDDVPSCDTSKLLDVVEQLSTQSMHFVQFINVALGMNLLYSHRSPESVPYKDIELMRIKDALRSFQLSIIEVPSSTKQPNLLHSITFPKPEGFHGPLSITLPGFNKTMSIADTRVSINT